MSVDSLFPSLGLSGHQFQKLSVNGFGDGHNSHAHSMALFKNKIFVGTTRALLPALSLHRNSDAWDYLNIWPVERPKSIDELYQIDRRAQIWSFDLYTRSWNHVFTSPLVSTSDFSDVPREFGYRSMCVFKGKADLEPCLYVATTAPGRSPGALILRSSDGQSFDQVSDYGILDLPITSIRSLIPFNNNIYTSPSGSRSSKHNISDFPIVYESDDPSSGRWRPVSEPGFGNSSNDAIFTLCPFNGFLYGGTLNNSGYEVWKTDCQGRPPYKWTRVISFGANRGKLNQGVISMCEFKDHLYIGSAIQNGGYDVYNDIGPAASELIRIDSNDKWEVIIGQHRLSGGHFSPPLAGLSPGCGNLFNGYFWHLSVHDGWLYLGTCNCCIMLSFANLNRLPPRGARLANQIGIDQLISNQAGFELWRSFDGVNWLPVDRHGFGNPYNIGIRNMISVNGSLYVGTANPYGPKIASYNNFCNEYEYVENPQGGLEVWEGSLSNS